MDLPMSIVFFRLDTLKMGVFDAISNYNKGNEAKCLVFQVLDLNRDEKKGRGSSSKS